MSEPEGPPVHVYVDKFDDVEFRVTLALADPADSDAVISQSLWREWLEVKERYDALQKKLREIPTSDD